MQGNWTAWEFQCNAPHSNYNALHSNYNALHNNCIATIMYRVGLQVLALSPLALAIDLSSRTRAPGPTLIMY